MIICKVSIEVTLFVAKVSYFWMMWNTILTDWSYACGWSIYSSTLTWVFHLLRGELLSICPN